jgi:predicted HicB family RNase H-like nuclease
MAITTSGRRIVSESKKERISFPLRLSPSLRARATLFAERDGVSLDYFINSAVAEKIRRLDSGGEEADSGEKGSETTNPPG